MSARHIERRRYMRRRATVRETQHRDRQTVRAMLRSLTREPLALPTDADSTPDEPQCDSDDSPTF